MNSLDNKQHSFLVSQIYRHPFVFYLIIGCLVLIIYQYVSFDIDARDTRGRTALYLAAEQGDLQTVTQLIANGASVDARDNCRWTPFMRAAQNGHLDVVKILLNAGADINAIDKDGYDALIATVITHQTVMMNYLLAQGLHMNTQDKTMGWTALIWAVKENKEDMVDSLLTRGADKSIVDKEGKTAYDWAIEKEHTHLADRVRTGNI